MDAFANRHIRIGWAAVALFMALGITLEALHGFKIGWYLEEDYQTRRLLFTLAHAHGALLGIVNIVFGLTVGRGLAGRATETASRLLLAGTALLPAGFFLGGLYIYDGDPGLGVALTPIGAVAVLFAAILAALPAKPKTSDQPPVDASKPKRRRGRN